MERETSPTPENPGNQHTTRLDRALPAPRPPLRLPLEGRPSTTSIDLARLQIQDSTFPFSKLPAELRNEVYKQIALDLVTSQRPTLGRTIRACYDGKSETDSIPDFTWSDDVTWLQGGQPCQNAVAPEMRALNQVSRQAWQEFVPVWLESTVRHIKLDLDFWHFVDLRCPRQRPYFFRHGHFAFALGQRVHGYLESVEEAYGHGAAKKVQRLHLYDTFLTPELVFWRMFDHSGDTISLLDLMDGNILGRALEFVDSDLAHEDLVVELEIVAMPRICFSHARSRRGHRRFHRRVFEFRRQVFRERRAPGAKRSDWVCQMQSRVQRRILVDPRCRKYDERYGSVDVPEAHAWVDVFTGIAV